MVLDMDSGITSAVAAVMGAFMGGLASLASTWVGERSRNRRDLLQGEIAKREATYSDFIGKATRLLAESATHHVEESVDEIMVGLVSLYAVSSRIRLFASDRVLLAAEQVVERILVRFGDENISAEQLRTILLERKEDLLKDFSIACRHELQDLQRGM
jgi:hypothetical protein